MKLGRKENSLFQNKIPAIHYNEFQTYANFYVVFYMFKCINPTFNQHKKCSFDKTGEGNVVLDLTISDQKCPKLVTQVEQIYVQTSNVLLKTTAFFSHI